MLTYTTISAATTVTMFVRQADPVQQTSNTPTSTPSSTSTSIADPLAQAISQSASYRTSLVAVSLVLTFLVLGIMGYCLYPVYKRFRAKRQVQETRQWPSAPVISAPQVPSRAPSRATTDDGFEMSSLSTKDTRPDATWFANKRGGVHGDQMI